MPFEDLYAHRFDAAITRTLLNPGPPPEGESFSLWSFGAAGARGLPAAALEVGGSALDALAGSAQEVARRPRLKVLQDQPDDLERRQATAKFVSEGGTIMRNKASEMAPDPLTSHVADQALFGVTRFGTKLVAGTLAAGPYGGAALAGAEETNTVFQRLKGEGVDPTTAFKAGVVQGGISAAGAVLPVGGSTLARTAALTLFGGPGAFMAQEALSRKILEAYPEQAKKHDPTDGLGLALSLAIPGAFGALHLRGVNARAAQVEAGRVPLEQMTVAERQGLKFNDAALDDYASRAAEAHGVPPSILLAVKNAGEKSNSTATSPKGAQGVMQFMPATWKEIGVGDPKDPVLSINAGAAYLRKLFDQYGSWDAAVAHYNGGGEQARLVKAGERPSFPETAAYLDRVRQYVSDHTASSAAKNPDLVDAARVRVTGDALARSLPDHPDAFSEMQRAGDAVAAGEHVDVPPPVTIDPIDTQMARLGEESTFLPEKDAAGGAMRTAAAPESTPAALMAALKVARENDRPDVASVIVHRLERGADAAEAGVPPVPLQGDRPASHAEPLALAAQARADATAARAAHPEAPPRPTPEPQPPVRSQPARPTQNTLPRHDVVAEAAGSTAKPAKAEAPSLDSQRVAMLLQDKPDMPVKLPGSDTTMSASEALAQAKEAAAYEAKEADLYKAALDCALGV